MFSVSEVIDLSKFGNALNSICNDGKTLFAVFGSGELLKVNLNPYEVYQTNLTHEYNAEQPVAVSVFEDHIYISDWHNHRILELDRSFNCTSIYGHHWSGGMRKSLRTILRKHRIILNHDTGEQGSIPQVNRLRKMLYFFARICGGDQLGLSKPNGCYLTKDEIQIVSKNDSNILVCNEKFVPTLRITNDTFGRIGGVCQTSTRPIYCDEQNNRLIWIDETKKITFIDTVLPPFTALVRKSKDVLCVGSRGIELLDSSRQSKFTYTEQTDLHSITEMSGRFFVSQRESSKIFEINFD